MTIVRNQVPESLRKPFETFPTLRGNVLSEIQPGSGDSPEKIRNRPQDSQWGFFEFSSGTFVPKRIRLFSGKLPELFECFRKAD